MDWSKRSLMAEEGSRRELWEYADIFAEDGNMLFSVEY